MCDSVKQLVYGLTLGPLTFMAWLVLNRLATLFTMTHILIYVFLSSFFGSFWSLAVQAAQLLAGTGRRSFGQYFF